MTLFRRWFVRTPPDEDGATVVRAFVATLARLDALARDLDPDDRDETRR